jgi:parvulin-like peptidyl-prolyl isomerase
MHVRGLNCLPLGLIASVLLLASSCKHQTTENTEKPKDITAVLPKVSSGLAPEQARVVLARVGEKAITVGDYAAALQRMDRFERLRYQSPERRKQLLDELIAIELLADEARRQGLDRELDTQLRLDQAVRDEVLGDLRAAEPTPDSIPESEVRSYYDSHKDEFMEPERRRVAEVVATRVEEAKRVIEAARNASAQDWGRLVRKNSTGRKDASGSVPLELEGDLGIVSSPGEGSSSEPKVPEAVVKAVFSIDKVGGVSDEPVLVQNQYHVVRLSSRMQARLRTFAEAERSIRIKLVQQRIEASQQRLLDDLRKRIPVSVNQALLATIKSSPK